MDRDELRLTAEEESMLHGEHGIAIQRAMEIVVALGRIYGARHLVRVTSVQVAGVSYKNLSEAGLAFLNEWASQGARVCVPTTLNPAGMDMAQWHVLGFSEAFAQRQQAIVDAYVAMGIRPTCTCTPYLAGNAPATGDHIAWAESSAVSYANSVLGAYTNREGGPSALAAGIVGRTAAYGLHLPENRLAQYRIDVRCPLRTISDWSALGYLVGRQVRGGVPYFCLQDVSVDADRMPDAGLVDCLKSLGAAMAASGAVALYHVDGITPEAQEANVLSSETRQIVIDDLEAGYQALNGSDRRVDLVSVGCPHASPSEIGDISRAVAGKHLSADLWVTTARETREQMSNEVEIIKAAGGRVVADTCMVVAPVEQLGFRVMATNSAKMAIYTPSHSGLAVRFGSLAHCIKAAVTGRWDREQRGQ
jgi:predicted aconitase